MDTVNQRPGEIFPFALAVNKQIYRPRLMSVHDRQNGCQTAPVFTLISCLRFVCSTESELA